MSDFHKWPQDIFPANQDERACLEESLARLRADWGFADSYKLDDLLMHWAVFVYDVRNGFTDCLEEYTFSLSLRDAVDEMVRSLPDRLNNAISNFFEQLDNSFILATREVNEPLNIGEAGEAISMRWFRVPKLLYPQAEDSSWQGIRK
jgi:hypothetical protein